MQKNFQRKLIVNLWFMHIELFYDIKIRLKLSSIIASSKGIFITMMSIIRVIVTSILPYLYFFFKVLLLKFLLND